MKNILNKIDKILRNLTVVKPLACDSHLELRNQVLNLKLGQTPELADQKSGTYAIMFETAFKAQSFSLVVVSDGSVSLYFSNGGGIVGAGRFEEVRSIASKFFEAAAGRRVFFKKVDSVELPINGTAQFVLVTTEGFFVVSDPEINMGSPHHEFYDLFCKAHDLIKSIREVAEF